MYILNVLIAFQDLTVLLCWGIYTGIGPWFYSKLLVQFQELVEIIDIKCPLAYLGGWARGSCLPPPPKIGKGVVLIK